MPDRIDEMQDIMTELALMYQSPVRDIAAVLVLVDRLIELEEMNDE